MYYFSLCMATYMAKSEVNDWDLSNPIHLDLCGAPIFVMYVAM
jgi:hypothetical protein